MTAGHVAMWGIVGGHRRFSTSRARRGALCGPRVVYRGGWRLPFCAPSRDALPGLSRSSPHIAISAASDPCVGTVDIRGWAMTAGPDTRNGARICCIHIRKSAYFSINRAFCFCCALPGLRFALFLLRAFLEVSRCRAHAPRGPALRAVSAAPYQGIVSGIVAKTFPV